MAETQVSDADLALVAAERAAALDDAAAEPREPVQVVEDVDAGGVPARRYDPGNAPGTLLYFHGGGFVHGDLTTHDGISRRLANRTGWAVLLVDYRRAPEHPWPAADHDAAAAAAWLTGQDTGPLVAVGDSAGAALALAETRRHPDRYAGQVLVYPFIDPGGASYDHRLSGVELDPDRCGFFWRLYLQGADAGADPGLGALTGDLQGLPRTLVQLAERDVLTPTGRLLVERLAAAEVPTEAAELLGVEHGFWRQAGDDQSEVALAGIAAFLSGP